MRIQRIIFILIHLPFPFFSLPCLSLLSSSLLFSSLLFFLDPYSPVARTVSSVIRSPIHTRQARASCKRERGKEREREATTTVEGRNQEGQGGKKNAVYPLPSLRGHLSFWCRAVSDSLIARPRVWSTLSGTHEEVADRSGHPADIWNWKDFSEIPAIRWRFIVKLSYPVISDEISWILKMSGLNDY